MQTLFTVGLRHKPRKLEIPGDYRRMLADMRPSPCRFSANVSSKYYSRTPLPSKEEGEVVPSARSNTSYALSIPHFHPSPTGIDGAAGDERTNSTLVEIIVNAGLPVVATHVRFLTVGCPCPCKAMRKVYG